MTSRIIAAVIMLGLFAVFMVRGAAAQPTVEKPTTATGEIEKIALFKNGLAFVVSHFTLPPDSRSIRIGQLPIPTAGTFWVSYPSDIKLNSLTTAMEDLDLREPVQSLGQLLQLNAGRKVLIHTSDRDIEGTVLPPPIFKRKPDSPSPYFMSPHTLRDQPHVVGADNLILVRTDKGTVALNPSSILRAEFADGELVTTAHATQQQPSIRLSLAKPADGEKITVSYLARGMTWIPGYLVDLSDPKTAHFSAHAVIVNEMTDLNDVKVELVTGFPNIAFSGVTNPIARSENLAAFLQSMGGGAQRHYGRDNMMMQQAVMVNAPSVYSAEESGIAPGYSSAAVGEAAEDLYFYPAKNLSLRRDETAWLPLFTANMPYKHIYTWKIRDFVDAQDQYQAERSDQQQGEEIWHSCRLTNTLTMPLTTAATEFITNNQITGQDVCYYTPPKAETTIRINKALNITAEKAESEVDRKRDATVVRGYHYDLVKVQGELRIRNRLAKEVSVEITKELSGEVLDKGPNATDTKTAEGLKKVNPKHILTWTIEMKAGEEKKIAYVYQVYIRD
jgi:hypothetical protein